MKDIIIVGGGPAGLSAAITAVQRNHSVTIISNDRTKSGLYRAPKVENYPGLPGVSGPDLLDRMVSHAETAGVEIVLGHVISILPAGNVINVSYGADFAESRSVIIAAGISQSSLFPGEEDLLGRGVSYCATCDGMLFRGKRVCVVCLTPHAEEEADYLASIGCDVVRVYSNKVVINGSSNVTSISADGEEIVCSGVFVLRHTVAPHLLLPGLDTVNGHIAADASGKTNVPGVFAAGDCVGTPYQIAKATGQGLTAALSASEYVKNIKSAV